ncbi:MAG TPA: hypothetical protein VHN99_08185 [Deinococcales bacterium]|nr:hypothetical protein [Deinococcales bacterium]
MKATSLWALALLACLNLGAARAASELVTLQDSSGSLAVVTRSNGETWLVRLSGMCWSLGSLASLQARPAVLDLPGFSIDFRSTLVPERELTGCPVSEARRLGNLSSPGFFPAPVGSAFGCQDLTLEGALAGGTVLLSDRSVYRTDPADAGRLSGWHPGDRVRACAGTLTAPGRGAGVKATRLR